MSERAGEVECTGEEERESDLNVVGPKIVETGLTGQTGCPYRLDRSGPDCQEHFGLVICRVGFGTNDRD